MARAVLFMWDPTMNKTTTDVFETPEYADPFHTAQGLKESCEGDFPNAIWSIGIDEEAREIMKNARMRAMGFGDDDG